MSKEEVKSGGLPAEDRAAPEEVTRPDMNRSSQNRTELNISDSDLALFFKQLLEQNPTSPLFVIMAESLCSRERWSEAVEIIRRGLEFSPRHFRGRVLLGWALWQLGRGEEAARVLAEVRVEMEENAIIYKVLAEMADREGDAAQAWRLMHIYQSLQDDIPAPKSKKPPEAAVEEPSAEPEQPPEPEHLQEPEQPPEPVQLQEPEQPEEPSSVKFLHSLLSRFERRAAEPTSLPRIFSDLDRQMLNRILDAGTS